MYKPAKWRTSSRRSSIMWKRERATTSPFGDSRSDDDVADHVVSYPTAAAATTRPGAARASCAPSSGSCPRRRSRACRPRWRATGRGASSTCRPRRRGRCSPASVSRRAARLAGRETARPRAACRGVGRRLLGPGRPSRRRGLPRGFFALRLFTSLPRGHVLRPCLHLVAHGCLRSAASRARSRHSVLFDVAAVVAMKAHPVRPFRREALVRLPEVLRSSALISVAGELTRL